MIASVRCGASAPRRVRRRLPRLRRADRARARAAVGLAARARRADGHDPVRDRAAGRWKPRPRLDTLLRVANALDCTLELELRPRTTIEGGQPMTEPLTSKSSHTTKSEKLLALVLASFLLIGGVWSYQEIDDRVRLAPGARPTPRGAGDARPARTRHRAAVPGGAGVPRQRGARAQARGVPHRARRGRAAAALRLRYRAARRSATRLGGERTGPHGAEARAQAGGRGGAASSSGSDIEERRDRQELVTFLLRLALPRSRSRLSLLTRLRDRGSRCSARRLGRLFATILRSWSRSTT